MSLRKLIFPASSSDALCSILLDSLPFIFSPFGQRHELRNPVSAILHNSELAKQSLVAIREVMVASLENGSMVSVTSDMLAAIEQDIESLDSINMCALAQERIANGVSQYLYRCRLTFLRALTLSYLY